MTLSLSRIESAEPSWKDSGAVAGLQQERAPARRPRRGARCRRRASPAKTSGGRRGQLGLDARQVRRRRARSGSGRSVGSRQEPGSHVPVGSCIIPSVRGGGATRQRGVALPVAPRRVGLFGGTFDPPHLGHVAALRAAAAMGRFDLLEVTVAGDPYLKRDRGDLMPAALRLRDGRGRLRYLAAGRGVGPRAAPRRADLHDRHGARAARRTATWSTSSWGPTSRRSSTPGTRPTSSRAWFAWASCRGRGGEGVPGGRLAGLRDPDGSGGPVLDLHPRPVPDHDDLAVYLPESVIPLYQSLRG